ncbi:MAG: choice-of-anchor Q domain-containing protein [Anaerolineales bacterium]|nr:choice-of-anchor Q domain-containing protein [Anaerolineales bacterium]
MLKNRVGLVLLTLFLSITAVSGLAFGATHALQSQEQESTITVDTMVDDTDLNGNCTLREAVIAANTDLAVDQCQAGNGVDTILLPAGLFSLSIAGAGEDFAATGDLDINSSLTLIGTGPDPSNIDGGSLDRVFHINPADAGPINVNFINVGLEHGQAGNGGGMQVVFSSTVTLVDVRVSNNQASQFGGGISNISSTLTVLDSAIQANSTGSSGGGLHNYQGQLFVFQTDVVNNTAMFSGGGIFNRGANSQATINDSVISNNTGTGGGGVANQGKITISNTVIAGNISLFVGGALFNYNSNPNRGAAKISNTSVVANDAFEGGGLANTGDLIVTGSTIANNSANVGGGGVSSQGVFTMTNSTLSGNSVSGDGGGVRFSSFHMYLNNVTITNNSAGGENGNGGGGIYIYASEGDRITIQNSILAGNIDQSLTSPQHDCGAAFGEISSGGHNLIGVTDGCQLVPGPGDMTGTLSAPLDPLLGPLQDYGGPTETHLPLEGSPAIDSGSPAVPGSDPIACETIDQRGLSRPLGLACDIGPYEVGGLLVEKIDLIDPVLIGNPLTYQITVHNTDFISATNVALTDTLPSDNVLSMADGCALQSGQMVCNLGDLYLGAPAVVTVTITPTIVGTITNTVFAIGDSFDPYLGDNLALETTFIAQSNVYLPTIARQK